MITPKVYLDEDTQSEALIHALRSRGVSLLTTSEAGMSKQTDEDQLHFAKTEGRILVTSNIADFARLHREWIESNRSHAGIILVRQQKWKAGELARRNVRLLTRTEEEKMHNRLEFLSGDGK